MAFEPVTLQTGTTAQALCKEKCLFHRLKSAAIISSTAGGGPVPAAAVNNIPRVVANQDSCLQRQQS